MPESGQPDATAITVRDTLSANVAAGIAARVGYMLSRICIPPFVLAHVSLEAYGLWSAAFILVEYLSVSTAGVSNVYVKYVAEFSARGEHRRSNELLSTGLMTTVPLCAAVYAMVSWLWPRIVVWLGVSSTLRADASSVVLIVVATFLASIAFSPFRDVLHGIQRGAAVQIAWTIGYLVEMILIFVLVGRGRGIRGLAEAFLIRCALELAIEAALSFRLASWLRFSPRLCTRASLRTLLAFGGTVQLASLLSAVLNSVERVLAAPLAGLQATGLLEIAQKLPSMATFVPNVFAAALVPAASYLQSGQKSTGLESETMVKLYLKGARYMNIVTAYLCAFCVFLPGPMLRVWLGSAYGHVGLLVALFSLAAQARLLTAPGAAILKGAGRPREELRYNLANILTLAVCVPAGRWIAGEWNTLSIGASVALAGALAALYFLRWGRRLLGISRGLLWRRVLLPGSIPYAIAALVAAPFWFYTDASRWVLAAWLTAAALVYTGACFGVIFGMVLDRGERAWFILWMRDQMARVPGMARQLPGV